MFTMMMFVVMVLMSVVAMVVVLGVVLVVAMVMFTGMVRSSCRSCFCISIFVGDCISYIVQCM